MIYLNVSSKDRKQKKHKFKNKLNSSRRKSKLYCSKSTEESQQLILTLGSTGFYWVLLGSTGIY